MSWSMVATNLSLKWSALTWSWNINKTVRLKPHSCSRPNKNHSRLIVIHNSIRSNVHRDGHRDGHRHGRHHYQHEQVKIQKPIKVKVPEDRQPLRHHTNMARHHPAPTGILLDDHQRRQRRPILDHNRTATLLGGNLDNMVYNHELVLDELHRVRRLHQRAHTRGLQWQQPLVESKEFSKEFSKVFKKYRS